MLTWEEIQQLLQQPKTSDHTSYIYKNFRKFFSDFFIFFNKFALKLPLKHD